MKNLRFRERYDVQFRGEFFNICSEVVDRFISAFRTEVTPALAKDMSSGVADILQIEFRPTMQRDSLEHTVYVASFQSRVWKWAPDGQFTIVAGNGDSFDGCAASGGLRLARNASVNPSDVALDSAGRLYVADSGSLAIPQGPFHSMHL